MFTAVLLLALASSACCFDREIDEKYKKLPRDEFIKYFNSQNFSYKIAHYEGIEKKAQHCTVVANIIPIPVPINETTKYMGHYVPKEFNGMRRWRHCYEQPDDQGECASCWAVATANVASIRTCLRHSRFPPCRGIPQNIGPVRFGGLSPLDLSCCTDCYNTTNTFCSEGSPEKAALFWIKNGLVTNICKPNLSNTNLTEMTCKEECMDDGLYYNADKKFGVEANMLLENDHEIRREIVTFGPVVATFFLHEDLRDYKEGVYEHTHGDLIGFHTVSVIGYGVENDTPYWLAANTWGDDWGDRGTFKVKRFGSDLFFETRMLSLIAR